MPTLTLTVESHTISGPSATLTVRVAGLPNPLAALAGMVGDVDTTTGQHEGDIDALVTWTFPASPDDDQAVAADAQRVYARSLIESAIARNTPAEPEPITPPGTEL